MMDFKLSSIVVFLLAGVSLISGIVFGLDIGAMTGAVLFIKEEFLLENAQIGWVVGISLLGCAIGSSISAPLSRFLGRRTLLFISTLIYFISALGLSLSISISHLYLFRFTVGLGIGIASFATPLYISELSPKERRGALVSLYQLAITLGILISFCIGFFNASEKDWRSVFFFNTLISLILLFSIPFLPRSPRWLFMKGKLKEARQWLEKIREPDVVEFEWKEMNENKDQRKKIAKSLFYPFLLGLGVSFLQQITGINAVIFYAPSILHKTGLTDPETLLLATASIGVVNSLATILCLLIIDKVGRRPLLLVGLTGMFLSLSLLSFTFHFISEKETVFTIISLMLYITTFAFGIGPLFWVISSEIFPAAYRSLGMGLAILINWITNFLVSSTFLPLTDYISFGGAFAIFGLFTILAFIFIYKFLPETKGLSLEEIEALY